MSADWDVVDHRGASTIASVPAAKSSPGTPTAAPAAASATASITSPLTGSTRSGEVGVVGVAEDRHDGPPVEIAVALFARRLGREQTRVTGSVVQ